VCGEFVLEAMPVENGCHVIFGRGRRGVAFVFINRSRIGALGEHVTALSQHAEKRLIHRRTTDKRQCYTVVNNTSVVISLLPQV